MKLLVYLKFQKSLVKILLFYQIKKINCFNVNKNKLSFHLGIYRMYKFIILYIKKIYNFNIFECRSKSFKNL
jgi:hypothetical protein